MTHHTGVLDISWTLSSLQRDDHEVVVELLQQTDVRPNLARMRNNQVDIIIVDIADSLIQPFLYQVSAFNKPFNSTITIPLQSQRREHKGL